MINKNNCLMLIITVNLHLFRHQCAEASQIVLLFSLLLPYQYFNLILAPSGLRARGVRCKGHRRSKERAVNSIIV